VAKRRCIECGIEYPAQLNCFYWSQEITGELDTKCKWCRGKEFRQDVEEGYRICSKCFDKLPLVAFGRFKLGYLGYRSACKACQNHERRFYEHTRRGRVVSADYLKKHPKKKGDSWRRYQATEKYRLAKLGQGQRRRALKNKVRSAFSIEDWQRCLTYHANRCAYCGAPATPDKPLQQDHFIPLSKRGAYVAGNILPACKSCNSSKHDKDFFKWYPKFKHYSPERERRILEYIASFSHKFTNPVGSSRRSQVS
jgi:5-methylcytosine-specific restriction endonuclease McrA